MKRFFKTDSIESKLRRYFVVLTLIIIAVLWVFQGFFLDAFYRHTKSTKIINLAHRIESTYLEGNLKDFTEEALNTESHVQFINASGVVLIDTVGIPAPQIQVQNARVYQMIFSSLDVGQGRVIDINALANASSVPTTRLSYALKLDTNVLLFIQTDMVPVSATVETIQYQLIVVTGLVLVVAIVLSRILSRKVSMPMVAIAQGADRIAQGDYDSEIKAQGYREIESLSNTLNAMRIDLNRVETMRNELLANVSHDLRTPLTMIQGYLELMKDFPEEMNDQNLNILIEESSRLKEMIQNLLDLSRIQTGLQTLKEERFEIADWFASNQLRYQELFKSRKIEFKWDDYEAFGDKTLLQQALDNLIQNAIKHTQGNVWVEGKCLESGYEVCVKDEGEGIDPNLHDSIWERYYTTSKDHSRTHESYGLGLSIVQRIFETQGLDYGYRPNTPKGSIFYFTFKTNHD